MKGERERRRRTSRILHRSGEKVGLPPGTAIHIGEPRTEDVRLSVLDYTESRCDERHLERIEDAFGYRETDSVSWINVDGVHDAAKIEVIGERFGLHPLVVEDVLHTGQRAKLETYDDVAYIVLRMLSWDDARGEIDDEQVSLLLGPKWILTFQERPGDVFDELRDRIRTARGRIRREGVDYLAYSVFDVIVDQYFLILERIGEQVEELDDEIAGRPTPENLQTIRRLKRELLFLRKAVWPLREVLSSIRRDGSALFRDETLVFLRDVYDHTIQVIDTVETYRDMVSTMIDLYLSSISNRMNEVMKVLTIIATIFIPLTFIAGIYGMNFDVMPELRWPFGYFAVLGAMGAIAAAMLVYFRRRRWL